MKDFLLVLCIILYVTMCSIGQHRANGSSIQLEEDLKGGSGYKTAKELFQGEDRRSLQQKTDKALDNLIKTTVGELRKKRNALSEIIWNEYQGRFKGFVYTFGKNRDLGDHEAIAWLLSIHNEVHLALGDEICRAARLHDLWVFAVTIPTVFNCGGVDFPEYYKHYSPLLGATAYWSSFGGCVAITLTTGVVATCGLVGMVCEEATIQIIAPLTVDAAYNAACIKPIYFPGK